LTDSADGPPRLSKRQRECLQGIAEGLTSAEIAASLGLSARTVDHYVGDACGKLKVRSRAHAVAEAIRWGEITSPSKAPP